MQVIIPVAGKGTRMRPHTHTKPKPLLHIAGKPAIDHILDEIADLDFVSEVIFITGHKAKEFEEYVTKTHKFKMRFVEQNILDGSSGAINLAKPFIKEDILIAFSDTIFDVDLSEIKDSDSDGMIWVQEVEDYERFGIVTKDKNSFMVDLVEKPTEPLTRLANIGMYYVRDFKLLFDCIQEQYDNKLSLKGEYYLPEALKMMVDKRARIKVVKAKGWYDTGKPETILASQHILLEKRHKVGTTKNCEIKKPVYIEEGAIVEDSVIGPNVSIAAGAEVKNSVVKDSIIGIKAKVIDCSLESSLVGEEAEVTGFSGSVNVGDHSQIVIGEHEHSA